jgi:hypothetical protein
MTSVSFRAPWLDRRDGSRLDGSATAPWGSRPKEAEARAVLGWVALLCVAFVAAVRFPAQDVALYHRWATALLHGHLSSGLPPEYPALATVLFVVPALFGLPYPVAFALFSALGVVALAVATGSILGGGSRAVRRLSLLLALATPWLLLGRYDVFPTLALVLAVGWARRGRWGRAWAAALVGGALQLFPLLALVVFFVVEWRSTNRAPWRRLGLAAAAAGAGAAIQQVLAPGTVLSPLRWQLQRGFELSSVPGTLTLLADPAHLVWAPGFGTLEVLGGPHALVATGVAVLEVLGLVVVVALVARGRLGVVEGTLALLSVAVLADRSFGPQYLIWIGPLWAVVLVGPHRPRRMTVALLVAAFAATTLTYPIVFEASVLAHCLLADTVMAAVRNALLVAATLSWLFERARATRGLGRASVGLRDPATGAPVASLLPEPAQ